MIFASTRDNSNRADFKTAIFKGLASDGGLFHPVSHPDLSKLYSGFNATTPFNEIASAVTWNLLKDEISEEQAADICNHAFDFEPALHKLNDRHQVLELFHGPSAAFKDYGASFLASAMESFLTDRKDHAVILTATSGDTGSAVARAFYKKANIDVVILYPSGRVSPLQEKQLTTLGGNIHALEVEGSFDDCQRMVKEAFTNAELNNKYNLTSANSINLGRLIPQSFYYTWAWARLKEEYGADKIRFTVPSGNFGNLTAGLLAQRWGMNINGFNAATNRNDIVPNYLDSGIYSPAPSVHTPSNAMDVGAPSNFERMQQLFSDHNEMKKAVSGYRFGDQETLDEIRRVLNQNHYHVCPHTAVGILASEQWIQENPGNDAQLVTLSTAHPGKFLEIVEEATGETPDLPERLSSLLNREKIADKISADSRGLTAALSKLI